MPAKVCPRCGAQYPNLKSATCPECFALLVPVDDVTAAELAAARAEVEQTPEFRLVKAADDERFKEQSFGACLAVVGITVLTLILGIALIVSAAHRRRPAPNNGGVGLGKRFPLAPPGLGAGGLSLTTLPVAAATLEDVFPPTLGPYRRLASDQKTVLPGTLTSLFHAAYAPPGGKPLDVYALPAGRPTDEQNEFRLGLALAAQTGGDRPLLFFPTEYWHFAALAAPGDTPGPAAFQDALVGHFRPIPAR
jgi:hypothetical protein